MPTITAYIGPTSFCALLYKSKEDYKFFYSAYVYVEELFSNYTTAEEFYTVILELFCKQNGVDFKTCDIYISGFVDVPLFKEKNIKCIEFTKLFENMNEYYPVLINDRAFATKFFMVSQTVFGLANSMDTDTLIKVNKSIYPNLIATDIGSQISIDKEVLQNVLREKIKWDPNTPVIFMGSRFFGDHVLDTDYIHMISFINTPGVYDLYLDRANQFLLFNMLNQSKGKVLEKLSLSDLEHLGTLITGYGDTECLIATEDAENKVIDIVKDTIETYPLPEDQETRIVVKNHSFGTVEKSIFGGEFGLIFDTRKSKDDAFTNIRKFSLYIRAFIK